MGFLIGQLIKAGLLHDDVRTVAGGGLAPYSKDPLLIDGVLEWRDGPVESLDKTVLCGLAEPFDAEGGLRLLKGNLGRGVMKISAVGETHRRIHAPVIVFDSQDAFVAAHKQGRLEQDFVAVLRFQGPRANGMPELHALTPILGALQDAGRKVALITDGRMSGATGKVPMVIHISPEVMAGGPLGRLRDGDMVLLDAEAGVIEAEVDDALWEARAAAPPKAPHSIVDDGLGRRLFGLFRAHALPAEEGGSSFGA